MFGRARPLREASDEEFDRGWGPVKTSGSAYVDLPRLDEETGQSWEETAQGEQDNESAASMSDDDERETLKPSASLQEVATKADSKLRHRSKGGKKQNRLTGVLEEDDSNEIDVNLNRLMEVGNTLNRGKGYCDHSVGVRQVASGYLFSTAYYMWFLVMAGAALCAGAIIMSLYLADSGNDTLAKFQHSWVNVRWHVDGDKKWSHVWDAAAVCYGLTFFMAAAFYFAYIFSPSMHLWNFRCFLHTGVLPMQAMDDIFANIPLVVLILCVSGQDDFFELLYGSGIWALGHALLNVSQSYGYDHHFVPMRSTPKLTFLAGLASLGLFWGTVIASLEYRTSDVKTEVNDGARVGIYTGFGIHLVSLVAWAYQIFYPNGLADNIYNTYKKAATKEGVTGEERPVFPSIFPLSELIKDRVQVDSVKNVKALISKYDGHCSDTFDAQVRSIREKYTSAKTKSAARGVPSVQLRFFVLQEDWQLFATKFIKWSSLRWAMSLAFKLAVTLSFVLGVALRLKVQANEAKVDA